MDAKSWIIIGFLLLTLVNLLFRRNISQDVFGREAREKLLSDFDEDQKFEDKYSR